MHVLSDPTSSSSGAHTPPSPVGDEVTTSPTRTKKMHEAHLARARWMTEVGWRLFSKRMAVRIYAAKAGVVIEIRRTPASRSSARPGMIPVDGAA